MSLALSGLLVALLTACGTSGGDGGGDGAPTPEQLAITVSADPKSVEAGGAVALKASVSGDGADPKAVEWSAEHGALSAATGAEVSWTAPAAAGKYEVTAAVTVDGRSAEATAEVEVTSPGSEVVPLSVSIEGDAAAVYGQALTLTAVVTGDGAADASVSWSVGSGVLSQATGLSTVWTAPAAEGPVEVTATIDGIGAADTLEIAVRLCDSGEWASEADPCLIGNAVQLQAMHQHLQGHFVLSGDIDASATATWDGGRGFLPIGAGAGSGFRGTLDGAGHVVSGLRVQRPELDSVGLLSRLGFGGRVDDLVLEDLDILGGLYTGGLVGENSGDISHVHTSGAVVGTVMTNSAGRRLAAVGGLVGEIPAGSIQDSSSTAEVAVILPEGEGSPSARLGGLAGGNGGGVIRRSFTASPGVRNLAGVIDGGTGGLVGVNWATIEDSYSRSVVESGGSNTGGLVGNNIANVNAGGLIRRSFTDLGASVTGTWNVGGLVGNSFGLVEHAYSLAETVTGTGRVGGLVGHLRESKQPGYEHLGIVIESYSMSGVMGDRDLGGLVGSAEEGSSVLRSYWDVQRSNQGDSAGGTGARGVGTHQMLLPATYESWAFGDVWTIEEGRDTPDLIDNPRPER